jgi:hypothetical protein
MNEQVAQLLKGLQQKTVAFSEVLQFIDSRYQHQPTAFKNGSAHNEATQNQGSARVFSFAQLNDLTEAETLWLFAEHYRAVVAHPEGTDHQNIRQFMQHGWAGVQFYGQALTQKEATE